MERQVTGGGMESGRGGVRNAMARERRFACRLAGYLAASAVSRVLPAMRLPRRKISPVKLAQWIGIYLAHTGAGLPLGAVAAGFGRNRKTAARACRVIEDWRDCPAFDAELSEAETLLRMACGIETRGINQ